MARAKVEARHDWGPRGAAVGGAQRSAAPFNPHASDSALRQRTGTPAASPSGNLAAHRPTRPQAGIGTPRFCTWATHRHATGFALGQPSGAPAGLPSGGDRHAAILPSGDASACHRLRPQATHRRTAILPSGLRRQATRLAFWIFSCRLLACGRSSGRADTTPKGKIAARRSRPEGESGGAPLGGPRAKPLACRCVA